MTQRFLDRDLELFKPAGANNAHKRFAMEEQSTKEFYRQFRTKHANMNINEINVVEDWDHPVEVGTTSDKEEIKEQAASYYSWLYSPKETSNLHKEELLNKMRQKQIPRGIAERAEGRITTEQVRQAIRKTGNDKAPGPDGLPGEFYKAYEEIVARPLKEALREAKEEGSLAPTMMEGDMILIYKKKDPKDIRNYRPITLLNTDYKILTKILASKMKWMCEASISHSQKGFVPGRQITDLTRQLYLLQDYVEAKDQEALLVLLDMEKAFDRCSWSFLQESMKAAGIGEEMRHWVSMLYNQHIPPRRRIKVNGESSPEFELGSGVAQGCPLSPLLFLFIAEPLTRLVMQDEELKGVKIGGYTHKIAQC